MTCCFLMIVLFVVCCCYCSFPLLFPAWLLGYLFAWFLICFTWAKSFSRTTFSLSHGRGKTVYTSPSLNPTCGIILSMVLLFVGCISFCWRNICLKCIQFASKYIAFAALLLFLSITRRVMDNDNLGKKKKWKWEKGARKQWVENFRWINRRT